MSTEYLTGVKYIELTQGKFSIVDDWVAPLVNQYKWGYMSGKRGGYVIRRRRKREGKGSTHILMHRFIWESVHGELANGLEINHINCKKLDNRLCNLETVTRRQQMQRTHKKVYGITASSCPGLYWREDAGMWQVRIYIKGTNYHLGYYVLEEEAAAAYWKALENYEERGIKPNTKRRNL